MTARRTRKAVPYRAEAMFDLVADVERYPEFAPYCAALRVASSDVKDGVGTMVADMIVAYGPFRERFRSRVSLDRPGLRIDARYVDGPFKDMLTVWRFHPDGEGGSIVDFEIDFEFRNPLLQAAARRVFERLFLHMADAFVKRADRVYGT